MKSNTVALENSNCSLFYRQLLQIYNSLKSKTNIILPTQWWLTDNDDWSVLYPQFGALRYRGGFWLLTFIEGYKSQRWQNWISRKGSRNWYSLKYQLRNGNLLVIYLNHRPNWGELWTLEPTPRYRVQRIVTMSVKCGWKGMIQQ